MRFLSLAGAHMPEGCLGEHPPIRGTRISGSEGI